MLGTPGSGWSAQSRKSSDGQTTDSSGPSGAPPGWVRLVRAGNVVSAFDSVRRQHVVGCEQRDDCDVVERLRGPRRERPQQRRRHGASHVPERGGAGHDCRVAGPHAGPTPTPTPTPPTGSTQSGWTSGDIGSPLAAGATSVANGTFTVTGGGSDIWDSADQFQFVYQQVTGDAQIVARVASLSAAHPWAKAGVMIRQSLAAGSPHAAMLGTPGSGWSAQSRKSSDGADHRQLGSERRTAGLGAARAGGQCRERLSLVRRQHVVGCEQRDDCDVVERLRGPRRERPQQRRRHGQSHVPERGRPRRHVSTSSGKSIANGVAFVSSSGRNVHGPGDDDAQCGCRRRGWLGGSDRFLRWLAADPVGHLESLQCQLDQRLRGYVLLEGRRHRRHRGDNDVVGSRRCRYASSSPGTSHTDASRVCALHR